MKKYRSIKEVQAKPMSYHEAGSERIRDYDKNSKDIEGYEVIYEDGYTSWSPKEVFEKGYITIKESTND